MDVHVGLDSGFEYALCMSKKCRQRHFKIVPVSCQILHGGMDNLNDPRFILLVLYFDFQSLIPELP